MTDDIQILPLTHPDYPPLLKEISDPPTQLFIRGHVSALRSPHLLAVVGSRKASAYGRQCLSLIIDPVVRHGLSVVSGLAYGIDSLSHQLCLDHHVPTVAILGSGLDDAAIYPRRHVNLAHQIINDGGAVISEYPPGTPGLPAYFPARNRLIAGLAPATLVVQANTRSGSLITARLALDFGRDVWAIPGSINDTLSTGTNWLIQQGAKPILSAQDILDQYQLSPAPASNKNPHLTPEQQQVLRLLTTTPQHIDDIVEQANQPANAISVTLMELELINAAHHVGGMKYTLK